MSEHVSYVDWHGEQVQVGTHVMRDVHLFFPNENLTIYLPEGTAVTQQVLDAVCNLASGTHVTADQLQNLLSNVGGSGGTIATLPIEGGKLPLPGTIPVTGVTPGTPVVEPPVANPVVNPVKVPPVFIPPVSIRPLVIDRPTAPPDPDPPTIVEPSPPKKPDAPQKLPGLAQIPKPGPFRNPGL